MHSPYLSVIIPTFNRATQLENCLCALEGQTLSPESFEIIVVDDGSTDYTEKLIKKWRVAWPSLKALHQENAGQGRARNLALHEAQGQIILFIGDDIYGSPEFLQNHVRFHQDHPEKEAACLGLTEWDQSQPVTPFMKWLTHGGPQFAYKNLTPHEEASFWYFYTSNLSLKKELLLEDSFDPDFRAYGFEDIELGYRLTKKGLKLIYVPEALAVHDHPMEESSLKKRMMNVGKSAILFQKKQPDLKVLPQGAKKIILRILSAWPLIGLLWLLKTLVPPLFQRPYWYLLSKRYFFQGMDRI